MFLSIHLHPSGFVMSIIRNKTKPIVARLMVMYAGPETKVAASTAVHVPKNSSITTARGSSPQYLSMTLSVQIPIMKEANIKKHVTMNNVIGASTKYKVQGNPNYQSEECSCCTRRTRRESCSKSSRYNKMQYRYTFNIVLIIVTHSIFQTTILESSFRFCVPDQFSR